MYHLENGIMKQQQENVVRFESLIGTDRLNDIKSKRVLVIGIGGVGGYAVEALARSNIGTLIIADPDIVDESNLNRQIISLYSTIGKYKVDVMYNRLKDINPDINIIKYKLFVDEHNICKLLENVDYVIDACDTVSTKMSIIKKCKELNINFISCMGTGNKMDPTRLKIVDIRKTEYDPLAKKIRKYVKENNINGKIMVVSSNEEKYTNITNPIPSNTFVPAVAGMLCASYIINEIVK